MLDLQSQAAWADAQAPLCGITPVIDFVATAYGVRCAPNTRETIRDDAVKFFVENFILWHLVELSAKQELPFQFHTDTPASTAPTQ